MTTLTAAGVATQDAVGDHATFRTTPYMGSLDGLRCIAILAVLFHHAGAAVAWWPATERGFLGVDLFFVLSGFLIVTLLLRERDSRGQISLGRFYGRRMLRLFPVYYGLLGALTVLFLFVRPGGEMAQPFLESLPYLLTHTSNWVVVGGFMAIAWSLAAEEQFYLVWPAVTRFLRARYELVLLGVVILLNQLMALGVFDPLTQRLLGVVHTDLNIMQATFTPLCLGVLLAHLLHKEGGFTLMSRLLGRQWSPLLPVGAIVLVCSIPIELTPPTRLLLQVLMMFLVASVVIRPAHVLTPLLDWAPVRRVGVISYGMYLYHMVLLHFVMIVLMRLGVAWPWLAFIVLTAVTIVVAELSYRFYETPFLRIKQRLSHAPKAALAGGVAQPAN